MRNIEQNVALVTPFDSHGEIDFNDFSNLINWQIEKGTNGIVILGTTGEGYTLSRNEKIDLIKSAKKYFNVNIILDNNKDMSAVSKLHNLNDIDRNLISCEGRSYIGKWLHLIPK